MKIFNQRLLLAKAGLDRLSVYHNEAGDVLPRKLPTKIAFAARKNRRIMKDHLSDYEEQRQDLLKKFCKLDKEDKLVLVGEKKQNVEFKSPKDQKAYSEEHESLLLTEVEVAIHQVTEDSIEAMGEIEEQVLAGIEWMIEGWEELDLEKKDEKKDEKKETKKPEAK